MKAILSIHDVMPNTLEQVQGIIDILPSRAISKTTLLVVPGLDWKPDQIDQLKKWQDQGMELAGHGWVHQCSQIKGIKHRLHSLFISRNVAEHLSLSRQELIDLLNRNYQWFISNGLNPPKLYVPPAWAMGKLSKPDLKNSPYELFEVTNGVFDVQNQKFKTLPLVGFEADTTFRAIFLNAWNNFNVFIASDDRPFRVAIHPYDLELILADKIKQLIIRVNLFLDCSEIF